MPARSGDRLGVARARSRLLRRVRRHVGLAHTSSRLVLGPSSGLAWALSVVFLVLTLRALLDQAVHRPGAVGRAMRASSPQLAELRKRHGRDRRRLDEGD